MIPRLTREHRGQQSLARATPQEESEDLELDVVDVGDSESEETSFRFSLPWDQAGSVPMEDDEDASLTGGPTLRSARRDFPGGDDSGGKACRPPLPRDRDTLEYLDKMFKLGKQVAAAANNLGVGASP